MPDYKSLAASQIAAQVRDGKLSAVEIAQDALRLARTEGKEINAFISLCEEKALAQAKSIDAGAKSGPLAGVPIAVKDNISYTGYPTTCASHILDSYIPPYDATVVTRLIEAGAVIIGKTNMDEFAMGSSNENSYDGPVKNPVRHDLAPGGSSGGSCASVAQKVVPLALGSETGGSVRQPASLCGVFGLKPSYGAVSRYGLVALASSTDQIGQVARSTEDLALLFSVIAGKDKKDSTSVNLSNSDYVSNLKTNRKFRIGIPKEYFGEGLSPEVAGVVDNAKTALTKAGHTFVDISLPRTDKAIAVYYVIMCAEASANLARFDGVIFGLRESGDKSLVEMYSDTRDKGFGIEAKRRIMLGTYALSSGYYDAYYLKAASVRELLRREIAEAFDSVDLIISPTSPTPPFKLGEKINDPLAMYLSDIYTVTANLTGIPAISVPYGTTSDGLPVGVQFMAKYLDELSLFQISHILESLK
ncbi:MAG: Asp-tRNA(Asn)/Glu-tRNA(Gln) amidotransferase subunit GatA [Candidatus Zixiibacteriota bacterium]